MHALFLAIALQLGAPDLAPFLVGTSHPEIPRVAATPTELHAIKSRTLGLLQHPNTPGVREVVALAKDLQEAMRSREVGYIDAAWIVTRMRDQLAGKLTETTIRAMVDDVDGRLDDTRVRAGTRKTILRDLRDVTASAKNELP